MKKLIFTFFVTLSTTAFAKVGPQLFLTYGYIFDQQCANQTGYVIKPEWQVEVYNRLPEFQNAWDKEADVLMQTLFEQTGKSFSRHELTVTLSVCKMVSMSDPFIVNARRWLNSFSGPNTPAPIHGFVDVTFHEFLHNFLVENLNFPTPLIKKYENEAPGVQSHLHLMALQLLVYKTLNRQDMLDWIEYFYKMVGGSYVRAWEIVNIEGYQPFIDEIKGQK